MNAARKARLRGECTATTWAYPATGGALHVHGWQEGAWRYLDFWQYEAVLVARIPRVRNPTTGETMDRSLAYQAAVEEALPQAQIVHGACHLSADLNKAVDQVRRREHAQLLAQGDHTLAKTKYLWLTNPLNLSSVKLTCFEALVRLTLKTSRAWEIKELFGGFWAQDDALQGGDYFAKCYRRTQRCRLEPMKKLGKSGKASMPRLPTGSHTPSATPWPKASTA